MKKNKKQTSHKPQVKDESALTLKERLNVDLMEKLKATKTELIAQEQRKQEEMEAQRLFELKQKEKNKTFEELLNDSSLDWKGFK